MTGAGKRDGEIGSPESGGRYGTGSSDLPEYGSGLPRAGRYR